MATTLLGTENSEFLGAPARMGFPVGLQLIFLTFIFPPFKKKLNSFLICVSSCVCMCLLALCVGMDTKLRHFVGQVMAFISTPFRANDTLGEALTEFQTSLVPDLLWI